MAELARDAARPVPAPWCLEASDGTLDGAIDRSSGEMDVVAERGSD